MTRKLTYSLISSLVICAHASLGPVADLTIANANISPDGFNRSVVLAGGSHPGPVITGYKGDTFRINVTDALTDASMLTTTSVHWHGMNVPKANWADGPTFVNQCPISPGHSFMYEFNVTDQAGTFWYHSHHATQYCDGLRGPLIIYDSNDPYAALYDVDDESTIITLTDWYHKPAPSGGPHPDSDSVLINGLGRYKGGPASPLSIVNVVYGKRYRFRLIAMSCDANFVFSIDGHSLTVIEADGVNTDPLTVDSIQIFAGQRYSFVLNAIQPVDNYWIRANPSSGAAGFADGLNMAVLRYAGASFADPTTEGGVEFLNPLVETNLHPLENPGAPGEPNIDGADVSITMNLGFNFTREAFTVNGESLTAPTVPVLLQILSGTTDAASLMPSGSIYTLPPNKVIQISFPPSNAPGGPHPMHLHGHVFDVIRSANSSVYNYINPVRRDTVSTGFNGDNTTIRFKTDNSGPWVLHCHIDRHTAAGLGVILVEDAAGTTNSMGPVPDSWDELCPIYNALDQPELGGNASATSKRHDSGHGHYVQHMKLKHQFF